MKIWNTLLDPLRLEQALSDGVGKDSRNITTYVTMHVGEVSNQRALELCCL